MKGLSDLPKNLFDLSGKIAVVTGGAGFLGKQYCRALAEYGATVVVADIDKEKCAAIAGEISKGAVGLSVNLSREESVCDWAKTICGRFGTVDVLINNAAVKSPNFFAPLEGFPLRDWNQVIAVNITGAFLAIREIGGCMAKRGKGSIVNVSSIYGVVGPDQRIYEGSWYEEQGGAINTPIVYTASKGALIAMTKYLAAYWGPKGIRTNTLTPGGVKAGQNNIFHEKYSNRVPLGRMAVPEDLIGALIFLASDASSYVNGQNIIVDGGLTAW